MALKFLNKKGWHTGSLRNIENVWKAEQKHEAEQKKLEELRKQIVEERERAEFRELQEQAGLVPRQERLEFLYDSGLAVGKSSGFKALESLPAKTDPPDSTAASSSASKAQSAVPGALFEDKPQSANDAWRKLHSDPLLLIRQREQEALARVKNNPVQMAMIRKSVEAIKHKDKTGDEKDEKHKRKHHHHHKRSKHHRKSNHRSSSGSDEDPSEEWKRKKDTHTKREREEESGHARDRREYIDSRQRDTPKREENRRRRPVKLSEEERAARLREMQLDAELHEEQRWKRIKKEEEKDAKEAAIAGAQLSSGGRNFLDAAQRSIYGAEKGGSSTIEESVRRRTHYSQRRSDETSERNAFRR